MATFDINVKEALTALIARLLDEGIKPTHGELESLFESHGVDPQDLTITLVTKFMLWEEALDMNELKIVAHSSEDGFDPAIMTIAFIRMLGHENAVGRFRAVMRCQRRLFIRPEEEPLLMELANSDRDQCVRNEAKLALAMHGLL